MKYVLDSGTDTSDKDDSFNERSHTMHAHNPMIVVASSVSPVYAAGIPDNWLPPVPPQWALDIATHHMPEPDEPIEFNPAIHAK